MKTETFMVLAFLIALAGAQAVQANESGRSGIEPRQRYLLLDQRLIQSCRALREELQWIDYEDPIRLTIVRDNQLHEMTLQAITE